MCAFIAGNGYGAPVRFHLNRSGDALTRPGEDRLQQLAILIRKAECRRLEAVQLAVALLRRLTVQAKRVLGIATAAIV